MTPTQYRKVRVGALVRTNRAMRNAWGEIAAGTLMKVVRKTRGMTLETWPCGCCGLKATISQVRPESVELVRLHDEPQDGVT